MSCKEHPKYQAIRPPKKNCDSCRSFWEGELVKRLAEYEKANGPFWEAHFMKLREEHEANKDTAGREEPHAEDRGRVEQREPVSTSRLLERCLQTDVGRAEEQCGVLAGKVRKITPYLPYYATGNNTVIDRWDEPFEDRCGNKAVLTKVRFVTKKKGGKEEINEVVAQVRWL